MVCQSVVRTFAQRRDGAQRRSTPSYISTGDARDGQRTLSYGWALRSTGDIHQILDQNNRHNVRSGADSALYGTPNSV